MTPCLGPDEFVDLLEGQLPAARAAHVETCPACRKQFAWLAGTLRDARDVPVPEPSPLFWDHLAARVRAAVANGEAPRAPRRWWQAPVLAPALGLAGAVALLVATIDRVPATIAAPGVGLAEDLALEIGADPGDLVSGAGLAADATVPEDVPLDVMASLIDGLDWDELAAAGLAVEPGAADAAIAALAPAEREALARALRAALDGPES